MKTVHFTSGLPRACSTLRNVVKPLEPDWHDVLGREFSEQIKQSFDWINEL